MGFGEGLDMEGEGEGDIMDDYLVSRWVVGPFYEMRDSWRGPVLWGRLDI